MSFWNVWGVPILRSKVVTYVLPTGIDAKKGVSYVG